MCLTKFTINFFTFVTLIFLLGKFQKFRENSSTLNTNETFTSFVHIMLEEAKDNWKECLLKAVAERGTSSNIEIDNILCCKNIIHGNRQCILA